MNKIKYLFFAFTLLLLVGCKKDTVDGSNIKNFQSSINDMSSSLTTIEQIKFNEALYILKTFGVDKEGDIQELNALSQMLNGKKVPEILQMANEVAQKNGIEWSSTAPPSLGYMNIFQSQEPTKHDPNDIKASSISIEVQPYANGTALQIIPRLVDQSDNLVEFSNAGLETTLEIFSNGERLLTSKNLMLDNNFRGFNLKMASLPKEKVVDGMIDVQVSVKTSKKLLKILKKGVPVNEEALKVPVVVEEDTINDTLAENDEKTVANEEATPKNKPDPKIAVKSFLNNIGSQNLRAAYESASNPKWGSYEQFSNPTSGFGSVKTIAVKSLRTTSTDNNNATVNATYNVTDNNGNVSVLDAVYTLKSTDNGWKIVGYKINSSQKQ